MIRCVYVWAMQVSLRALRLRLVLPAGEFDVLPLCTLRLSSGLLPVGLGEHYASVFAAEEASGAAPRE